MFCVSSQVYPVAARLLANAAFIHLSHTPWGLVQPGSRSGAGQTAGEPLACTQCQQSFRGSSKFSDSIREAAPHLEIRMRIYVKGWRRGWREERGGQEGRRARHRWSGARPQAHWSSSTCPVQTRLLLHAGSSPTWSLELSLPPRSAWPDTHTSSDEATSPHRGI